MDSQCENLWVEKSLSGIDRHPIEDYGESENSDSKQGIIYQQRLRYNIMTLCIRNSLTKDEKCKLRAFKKSHTLNGKDDGAKMFLSL